MFCSPKIPPNISFSATLYYKTPFTDKNAISSREIIDCTKNKTYCDKQTFVKQIKKDFYKKYKDSNISEALENRSHVLPADSIEKEVDLKAEAFLTEINQLETELNVNFPARDIFVFKYINNDNKHPTIQFRYKPHSTTIKKMKVCMKMLPPKQLNIFDLTLPTYFKRWLKRFENNVNTRLQTK
jgi:hypothetical protein